MREYVYKSWWLVLALFPACALQTPRVTRIVDGIEAEGRPISDDAYAAYARAAALEAEGHDRPALAAYREALAADDESAEILARIAAIQCRLAPQTSPARSDVASKTFAAALSKDPESNVAWLELARCEARRGHRAEALAAAKRAVGSDPNSTTGALLVAALCEQNRDAACARTWLDGLTTLRPESREAWLALLAFAERHADLGRLLRARAGLLALRPAVKTEAASDAAAIPSPIVRARESASRRHVSPSGLALELLAEGRATLTREQAELVLGANPDDPDAWIALIGATELERDFARLGEVARQVPTSPAAPSPLAVRLHAELLGRLVGADARAAWLDAQRGAP
jgi:tetratricopeptide (TPR) repeat protein